MRTADTLVRLQGEPVIPPLMGKGAATGLKPIAAASILLLSLVGVLGFAASRYLGKKEAPVEPTPDVASATAARVTFKEAPAMPSAMPLAPPVAQTAAPNAAGSSRGLLASDQVLVPNIEASPLSSSQAIPVRGTQDGRPPKPRVAVGDESPFTEEGSARSSGGDVLASPSGYGATDPSRPGSSTAEAQANLKRYQNQLGTMLGQLQGLTDRAAVASGGGSADRPALGQASGLVNAVAAVQPALFGSMERSATPTVAATLMGNRSLTLPKGVLFSCSLKTRIISATSGFVACQVQRNVFSDDGKVVLAERGSHLDGEYRVVQVRPGVTRIPVLWTRLRTPHGVTVDLDSPATGALGESGIGGYVDNRWPERIGAALLVSLIDDAVKIVATDTNPTSGNTTVLLPSTTAAGSKLAEKVLEATINIPPLLYQNQGSVVGVYVARDVDFSKVYALEPR